MVRATKTTTKPEQSSTQTKPTISAASSVQQPIVDKKTDDKVLETAAPAVVKKTKKPKSTETSTTNNVIEQVVQSTATSQSENVAQPAVSVVALENDLADASMAVKMNIFGAKLQQLTGLLSSVKSDFKILEKLVTRELKNAQKSSRKKKVNPNRQPSGFVKPTRISDELAKFLGKDIGCEMARTDVSKESNAYIRSNGLQDKANGRKINADPKLSNLLKLNTEDELTYFNLQRYMKHHFIKAEVVVAPSIAV
jgi:chromatin remodeling complex protein RSC6